MLSSSYSVKYKQLQRQQFQQLKEAEAVDRGSRLVRSKRFQHETSKRRKALAIKRKLEQAKEERRRQEILAKRHEEIKSATERFQRLNKNYTAKTDAEIKADLTIIKPNVPLEEALYAVRGNPQLPYRSENYSPYQQPASPGTDSPRFQDSTIRRAVANNEQRYNYKYTTLKRGTASPVNQVLSSTKEATERKENGTSGIRPSPQLQDRSIRNVTDSRNLFEQKLENQQQLSTDKHNHALAQFNQNLTKTYITGSNYPVTSNSSSVSSDSLNSNKIKPERQNISDKDLSSYSSSSSSGFAVHRSSNSPSVAVVQPSVIRQSPPETSAKKPYNKNNYDFDSADTLNNSDYLRDSLEGSPINNSEANRSNLDIYLDNKPPNTTSVGTVNMSGVRNSPYNGVMYQEGTVGYASGVDFSYLRPGYNSAYSHGHSSNHLHPSVSEQHKRPQSGAWVTPSSAEINDVSKIVGNQQTSQSAALVTNVKPSTLRNTATNVTIPVEPNGYYLHSNTNGGGEYERYQSVGHTSTIANSTAPYSVSGSSVTNASTGSHYGNAASTYSNTIYQNSSAPTSNVTDSIQYHTNGTLQRHSNTVPNGHTTNQHYTSNEQHKEQKHSEDNYRTNHNKSEGTITTAANYISNREGKSSITKPVSTTSASSQRTSVLNERNINQSNTEIDKLGVRVPISETSSSSVSPTILPNYSLIYSNSDYNNLQSMSLNSRKPPVPAPRASIKNTVTTESNEKTNSHVRPVKSTVTTSESNERTTIPHPHVRPSSAVRPGPSRVAATKTDFDPPHIPRPKNPVNVDRAMSNHAAEENVVSSDESSSDVEREAVPEPVAKKMIKGILKKPSSATTSRPDRFGIQGRSAVKKPRSMSAHARVNIRDSMEVTKQHKTKKRRKKKMVRFVDMVYTNDSETDDDTEDEAHVHFNGQEITTKPPIQPVPPKLGATTTSTRPGRINSAGTQKKSSVHRPHPPNEPPTGRAMMAANLNKPQSKPASSQPSGGVQITQAQDAKSFASSHGHSNFNSSSNAMYSTATQGTTQVQNGAVYNENGLRLDRTPTDEEINWLWDKVRNCLHKDQSNGSSSTPNHPNPTTKADGNQYNIGSSQQQQYNNSNMAVNTRYIDGNSLPPQFRTQTRVSSATTRSQTKKVNMDTLGTYSRRAALLNQRKLKEQGNAAAGNIHYHQQDDGTNAVVQTSVKPLGYQQPVPSSSAVPVHSGVAGGYPSDVSESMAAFLAGEQLAGKSVTESQMEQAMLDAQQKQAAINSSRPSNKAPTALSIEEQRLMQSLERLNERLQGRGTDLAEHSSASSNSGHHGGFKGHTPLSSTHNKRLTPNTGVHQLRVSSAGARIQSYGLPSNRHLHL